MAVAAAALLLWTALSRSPGKTPPGVSRSVIQPSGATPPAAPGPVTAVSVTDLGPLLPTPLLGTAAAAFGGRVLLLGGSGPAGFSAAVYAFTPAAGAKGGTVAAIGRLPEALHDAGAAADAAGVLLCGGGRSVGEAAIYRVHPAGGTATPDGALPRALSDLEGVTVGGHPYCLGGWTGSTYSDAVYDLSGLAGGAVPVVARLPHAVRYAAALPLPGGVLVAGGRTSAGPTAAVQWVPVGATAGAPAVVGQLPRPLVYAMGATLAGTALVIGGCDPAGAPTSDILAVTAAGAVTAVGSLPQGVCYGSAAVVDGAVYVFGGQTADGAPTDHLWRITRRPPGP